MQVDFAISLSDAATTTGIAAVIDDFLETEFVATFNSLLLNNSVFSIGTTQLPVGAGGSRVLCLSPEGVFIACGKTSKPSSAPTTSPTAAEAVATTAAVASGAAAAAAASGAANCFVGGSEPVQAISDAAATAATLQGRITIMRLFSVH